MIKLLLGLWLSLSFSARSNQAGKPFDYEIATEIGKKNAFYFEVEKEREQGVEFYNHDFRLQQNYKFLIFKEGWQYINGDDIKNIAIEAKYNNLRSGIRQELSNGLPKTNIVLGSVFDRQIWRTLKLESSNYFFTSNLARWYSENTVKFVLDIYVFDVFWKSSVIKRDFTDWSTKIGIQYEL